jgi:hypothetical protein
MCFDIMQGSISFLQSNEFLKIGWAIISPNIHVLEKNIWVYDFVSIRLLTINWGLHDIIP